MIKVEMIKYPNIFEWCEVRKRALVTVGKTSDDIPTFDWSKRILRAHHSPIRDIWFAFYIECPYWVSNHLARHTHAQPYIKSQRNDRQSEYDRNAARQDAPVSMIWDMNAEELITICNKRLCVKAAAETREVVEMMRDLVLEKCPEFEGLLVPICEREHVCNEMYPCGKTPTEYDLKELATTITVRAYRNGYEDGLKGYVDEVSSVRDWV